MWPPPNAWPPTSPKRKPRRVFVAPHGVDHARFSEHEPGAGADAAVLDVLGRAGLAVLSEAVDEAV